MKLTKVTFTGVDERTDLKRLARLQRAFPFAEFGVLLSFDWKENGNRFPDPKILPSLEKLGLNLSAHFCGQSAFDVVGGKRFRIDELVGRYIRIFQRCQLNMKADTMVSYLRKLQPLPYMGEVIVQMHTPELCTEFLKEPSPAGLAYLLDASGGAGIDTPIDIITSPGIHIGYAGGMGPENVEKKLRTLLEAEGDDEIWIDMETRVRTLTADGEWFDLDKVENVLRTCNRLLVEYGYDTKNPTKITGE